MSKMYFKSAAVITRAACDTISKEIHFESDHLKCNCGESIGFKIIETKTGKIIEELILCESCYNKAPNIQKGE